MENTIIFLLCAVVMIPDSLGIKSDSSHRKNNILHGQLSSQEKPTCIASLQLNGIHICSSGLFRESFLLTTGPCAYDMFNGMTKKRQTGTALLGDSQLNKGQRVAIIDISYTIGVTDEYDVGLVLLPDTVDYTHIEIVPLYTNPTNIHLIGPKALVCGSRTISQDGLLKDDTDDAQYSQNLRCVGINLLRRERCQRVFSARDFERKLICGLALSRHENTPLGDVGSPLIKNIVENDGPGKYIIGVTLPRYQSGKDIFFKFVRINYGFPYIKKMMRDLRYHEEMYTDNIGSSGSEKDSLDRPSKRHKIERNYNKRNIYTGNKCLRRG